MNTSSNARPVDRDLIVRLARGFFAETFDARWAAGSGVTTSGVGSFSAIALYAGEVVSNLTIYIAAAGASLTLSKLGLYSSTGVRLAVSADQGAAWQTIGFKTVPMIAPYTVTTTGVYYIGELAVGATGPNIPRGSGGNVFLSFALPGALAGYYGQTGLADLPTQATFATGVSTAHNHWVGVS